MHSSVLSIDNTSHSQQHGHPFSLHKNKRFLRQGEITGINRLEMIHVIYPLILSAGADDKTSKDFLKNPELSASYCDSFQMPIPIDSMTHCEAYVSSPCLLYHFCTVHGCLHAILGGSKTGNLGRSCAAAGGSGPRRKGLLGGCRGTGP